MTEEDIAPALLEDDAAVVREGEGAYFVGSCIFSFLCLLCAGGVLFCGRERRG